MSRFSTRFARFSPLSASALAVALGLSAVTLAACGDQELVLGSAADDVSSVPGPDASACPAEPPIPMCGIGTGLVTDRDGNGCVTAHRCEPVVPPSCPAVATPICAANSKLVEKIDAQGCSSYTCEPIATCASLGGTCAQLAATCPGDKPREVASSVGSCDGPIESKCCVAECPTLSPPAPGFCPAGATIKPDIDATGCTRGYHCLHQINDRMDTTVVTARAGDEIELALAANATTGYRWVVGDDGPLAAPTERYVVTPGGGIGSGGTQYFLWSNVPAGTFPVRLDHGRAGQPVERSVTYTWNVQ